MNKKGFTLIELLAVIVILAIIALIATPVVLNIIDDAKNESDLRSAEFYLKSLELSIAQSTLEGKNITDNVYGILESGNICLENYVLENGKYVCKDSDGDANNNELIVEVKGKVPSSGTIAIQNGQIVDKLSTNANSKTELVINEQTIVMKDGELKYPDEKEEVSESSKLCTANVTKATALVYNGSDDPYQESSYIREEVGLLASEAGAYETGVSYTCNFIDNSEVNNMTFYVLLSTENEVTLIAGSNLGAAVAWNEDGDNHNSETEDKHAVTAKAALAQRTSNWFSLNGGKLNETQMKTIKLPTKDQITKAYTGAIPKWLYGYATTPIALGYWTSTPASHHWDYAYYVGYGFFDSQGDVDSVEYGVRPVITLAKSQI